MTDGGHPTTGDDVIDWTAIKVVAAFGGLRFLPWWLALSTNNANPILEIGPSAIRYRALSRRERPLADIAQVEVHTAWRTANLTFRFHGSAWTFTANVRELDEAARALKLFKGQVPLGPRARAIAAA